MRRTPAACARALAAAAVLAVVALPGVPAAAAAQPNLVLTDPDGVGVSPLRGAAPEILVSNRGGATATRVTLTVDIHEIDPGSVAIAVPAGSPGCVLTARIITCALGDLAPGRSVTVVPMRLSAVEGGTSGPNGAAILEVRADEWDSAPGDNSDRLPVSLGPDAPAPTTLVAALNTPGRRAGPGDRLPLYAAAQNQGTLALTEFRISLIVPIGGVIVERYRDCGYGDRWPQNGSQGFRYNPGNLECHLKLTLQPGETLPLFDPVTGDSLFHVAFGRNLSGPDRLQGFVFAFPEADPGRPDSGTGPSFAAAVGRLPVLDPGEEPDLRGEVGQATFDIWTRANRYDVAVTTPTVSRYGDYTNVEFRLVDNGPSDVGSLEYDFTAPEGTVVLFPPESASCTRVGQPEGSSVSKGLRCTTGGPIPSVHAGLPPIGLVVQLQITGTPRGEGTIVVRGAGVGSTESRWSNNTARFVIPPTGGGGDTDGDGTGGGGAGDDEGDDGPVLPITGAPVAAAVGVGGAAVLLGMVVLIMTRRRRA